MSKFDTNAFQKFVDEFKNESDRAAVILGAAKLDSLLGQILERHLLPSLSATDELLEGDSPLSTFSSKISIAYRLGLITPEFAKALHQVRRIRNSFAHELSGCSLDSGPQADRLKSLLLPLRPLPFFTVFKEAYFDASQTASDEFKACLSLMVARLENRLLATEPVAKDEAYAFIVKAWHDKEISKEDEAKEKA